MDCCGKMRKGGLSWCRLFFFFQAEDGIRDGRVTGVQTCALPIYRRLAAPRGADERGHAAGQNRQRHIRDRVKRSVVDVDALEVQPFGHLVLLPMTSWFPEILLSPGPRC